jgi:hypothetical protein
MRTRTRAFPSFLTGLSGALLVVASGAACTQHGDPADEIASALETENGGLDMEDEAPQFGLPDDFVDADVEDSVAFTDVMADDTETVAMLDAPGAVTADIAMLWGQLPPDLAPEDYVRDWSGRLRLNRGGLIVRRTIRFEAATDRVLPRTDRAEVRFDSQTRPHNDGLLITVVDPDPAAGPLVLTYERDDGASHELVLADLLEGPLVRDVGTEGDRIVAVALRRDRDPCDHGFGRGRWHALRDHLGRLIGRIFDASGEPIGHIRGIWGQRESGEQVFHGKYIDSEGRFRGIFGGHYRDGEMVGRWLTRGGEHGRLHGMYRESVPGPRVGGGFVLRWAETSCAQDLPVDE